MATYIKQGFTKGQILKADELNYMEAGIEANALVTASLNDDITTLSEEKFDKHQGAENANKLLMVAQTGGIIGAEVGEGLEVKDRLGKNVFHGEWENARYNNGSFTTVTSGKNYIAVREFFPVKPNTAYTISRQTAPNCAEIFFYLQQFSADKSWISGTSSIAGDDFVKVASKSFTTGGNTHFLAIYCYAPKGESWQDMIPGGLMIEEGTTATQYEEYGVVGVEIKLKDANVIPSYWDDQIEQKIASVNSLHKELGKDCFSFVAIADMHYMHNLGKCSPRLAKKIMDACDIKYAYALGDFTGSNSLNQKDKLLEEMENVETMLSPIRDRLLVVQGNHDGTWGSVDQNADGTITSPERHSYIITPGEMHHWLFRKVGLIGNVHFDETGTAYYIDDTASRVRYIALNSSCLDYELDNNGYSKYNAMAMFRFTQKQYDFLVEALMDGLDERWSVVIGAHAPLVAYETMWNGETGVEYMLMRDFLTAFRNKTTFSGSFAGTADNGFDDVFIEADFTKAEATLVGYFAGHIHDDYHYPHTTHGIDMIGTGADRQREEMTAGTDTEQSFDVVTVDKKNHKIYCTKIGFGDDREISYD